MKALVTGGGRFMGTALCRQLREQGHSVISYSRSHYPHLKALGVSTQRGDLVDEAALLKAAEGCNTVFHVAAKAGVWGSHKSFLDANLVGTQSVLNVCRKLSIPRLVYTSSPSVCFDGTDHIDADNRVPYAKKFLAPYPATKAEAERLVLSANSVQLAVCALRPHLIFGPGDPHLVPRLVQAAHAKRLARVGDGKNVVTMCYVENAAHAHVLAAKTLAPDAPHAGQAYFIGQEQPVVLWDWIAELFEKVGAPPLDKKFSQAKAYRIGAVCEFLWRLLPLPGEPPMTRFVANQLAASHSYSMEPARRDFGFGELVNLDQATAKTVEWLLNRSE
jgi:nucleoside-diphosphate-sugar epimerase